MAGRATEEKTVAQQVFPRRDPGADPSHEGDAIEDGFDGEGDGGGAARRVDIYRDTNVRYLGYANELGEAFAYFLPAGGVPASYAVAICYVLADTVDKTRLAHANAGAQLREDGAARLKPMSDAAVSSLQAKAAAGVFVDTVTWQLLASVAIPGFTIHQIVALATAAVAAATGEGGPLAEAVAGAGLGPDVLAAVPTFVGLGTIPFIVHPIDAAVHWGLNRTLRPLVRAWLCSPGEDGRTPCLGLCACDVDAGAGEEWSKSMIGDEAERAARGRGGTAPAGRSMEVEDGPQFGDAREGGGGAGAGGALSPEERARRTEELLASLDEDEGKK